MKKPNLGSLHRRFTSLLTALTFIVLAVTGIVAFVRPFSIQIVGLHALVGFLFVVLIGLHAINNIRPLKGYLHSRAVWVTLAVTIALTIIILKQPAPVRTILGLSSNLGPALERFEMTDHEMVFNYSPATSYKMKLAVRMGKSYHVDNPPNIAIWLENQGAYHIKTLLLPEPDSAKHLPYWSFKRNGWQRARREAEEKAGVDIISSDTPNGSFDPADYILPVDPENPMPYHLLIEINQPDDEQTSLVYSVEIDNADPRAFQLLALMGYPQLEQEREKGKEAWSLYYVDYSDERFASALELIDSALLTIDRQL